MKAHLKIISVCISLMTLLTLSSCRQWRERQEIVGLVNRWQGREILFPDSMIFTTMAEDTVLSPDSAAAPFKILTYVSGAGCMSCQLALSSWHNLIHETHTLKGEPVPFLIVLGTSDVSGLKRILMRDSFAYPVCIDSDDRLNRMNQFPKQTAFQTFLLDEENRVVALGNPVKNVKIRSLYLREIMKDPQTREAERARLRTNLERIEMGKIVLGRTKEVRIKLSNDGQYPFLLKEVTTSCDCTEVLCSWNKIPAGESRRLTVRIKAETAGGFNTEVCLYGNQKDSPFTLPLSGEVIQKRKAKYK